MVWAWSRRILPLGASLYAMVSLWAVAGRKPVAVLMLRPKLFGALARWREVQRPMSRLSRAPITERPHLVRAHLLMRGLRGW